MAEKNSLINIFCFKLPKTVTQPMCKEYDWRMAEIDRIWAAPNNNYSILQQQRGVVENLLAVCMFARYILGSMSGISGFYNRINSGEQQKERPIKIGSYVLNKEEQNHILSVIIPYQKLIRKYQIPTDFFEFTDTVEFLRKCVSLNNTQEYEVDDSF